jgi:hypothetical protein
MMASTAKVSLALLATLLLVSAVASAGPHKQQSNVPENHDCSCDGYEAKAKECEWPLQACDKDSEDFANYQLWCNELNNFRVDKREGNIPHTYNRSLTCKSNLGRKERDTIDRSMRLNAIPIGLSIWVDADSKIPFDTKVPQQSIDWSSKMTPVKDQGACGSCWAFATVGYMEYWYKKENGVTQSFSEQRLVSCDRSSFGCEGGYQDKALDYLMKTGTVLTSSYPYASGRSKKAGHCPRNNDALFKGPQTFAEYYLPAGSTLGDSASGNCTRLKQLLTHGPVVGSIYATTGLQQYDSGVFTDHECKTDGTTNHAIIITGFIKNYLNSGHDVFVVKNSWGKSWGTDGYFYIADSGNPCSLCSWFYYI